MCNPPRCHIIPSNIIYNTWWTRPCHRPHETESRFNGEESESNEKRESEKKRRKKLLKSMGLKLLLVLSVPTNIRCIGCWVSKARAAKRVQRLWHRGRTSERTTHKIAFERSRQKRRRSKKKNSRRVTDRVRDAFSLHQQQHRWPMLLKCSKIVPQTCHLSFDSFMVWCECAMCVYGFSAFSGEIYRYVMCLYMCTTSTCDECDIY